MLLEGAKQAALDLIDMLPALDFTIDNQVFSWFINVLKIINLVLPINQLLPILYIGFTITFFKLIWALILRVKSFIPTMGA